MSLARRAQLEGTAADEPTEAKSRVDAGTAEPTPPERPVVGTDGQAAANDHQAAETPDNQIQRSVDELTDLLSRSHDIRQDLLACGVKFHILNSLIELGANGNQKQQSELIETTLTSAAEAAGTRPIEREALCSSLDDLVALEKDLRHARHVASQLNLDVPTLNQLVQLIRLNPGDGGHKAVNTFVAYASAIGMSLDRVADIVRDHQDESGSVLPSIDRAGEPDVRARRRALVTDLCIGMVLSAVVMWFVL